MSVIGSVSPASCVEGLSSLVQLEHCHVVTGQPWPFLPVGQKVVAFTQGTFMMIIRVARYDSHA